jgi:hypothetical protein
MYTRIRSIFTFFLPYGPCLVGLEAGEGLRDGIGSDVTPAASRAVFIDPLEHVPMEWIRFHRRECG